MTLTETTAATLATATLIAFGTTAIPAPLLLPVFSIGAVTAAFAIAGYAWLRNSRRNTENLNAWDVAGGLLLVGIAAAVMSNPEAALAAFEPAEMLAANFNR